MTAAEEDNEGEKRAKQILKKPITIFKCSSDLVSVSGPFQLGESSTAYFPASARKKCLHSFSDQVGTQH